MGQRLESLFGADLLPKEECRGYVTALYHHKKDVEYVDVETKAKNIREWR